MISLAYALAPAATVSLFAAAIPVLAGLRQRHAAAPVTDEAAIDLTGHTSAADGSLEVAVRSRVGDARTLHLSASLYDADGIERARCEFPPRRLLSGRRVEVRLDPHSLPPGEYQAVIVAEFGGEWFGARYAWHHAPAPVRLAA